MMRLLVPAVLAVVTLNCALHAQIVRLPTAEAALVGRFAQGPMNLPLRVGPDEFDTIFGSNDFTAWPAEVQARHFFLNGGSALHIVRLREDGSWLEAFLGSPQDGSGLHALAPLRDLRFFIAPELSLLGSNEFLTGFAAVRALAEPRRLFFILDPPPGLTSAAAMIDWINAAVPDSARFCAVYFPYLQVPFGSTTVTTTASGAMAAIFERNDATRAIWESPSGSMFPLAASGITPVINSSEGTALNSANVCAIRNFSGIGIVPFGARTLHRAAEADRFIAVARTEDWVASSIHRWLAFAAVRDNDETLWSEIRLEVGSFLHSLWQDGAFAGNSPNEGYFTLCDANTTTPADVAAHQVNLLYGMALLQPSEFEIAQLSAASYDGARPIPRPTLRIRSFAGSVFMPFPTVPGFNYSFQAKAELTDEWSEQDLFYGDGAWRRAERLLDVPKNFYRVEVTAAR